MAVCPEVVPQEEWLSAREALLVKEKTLTAAHDELAAERRRAPWMMVEKDYLFEGSDGETDLAELFDGRRQLIVYHHMLKPDDPSPCTGCCMVGDQIPHLAHLQARDTSLVFVSRAPIRQIEAFRKRMGWQIPWFETKDDFNADFGVTGGFGLNVLYRQDNTIFRTYFTNGRGMETLGTPWTFLDLTPLGRQETWGDSPPGTPQTEPYQWWQLHDEYVWRGWPQTLLARKATKPKAASGSLQPDRQRQGDTRLKSVGLKPIGHRKVWPGTYRRPGAASLRAIARPR